MGHWRQPVLLFILPKKTARNERFPFISCGFLLWAYVTALHHELKYLLYS